MKTQNTQELGATAKKSCKVENCKRPYRAKGYCTVHYQKWRRGEMDKKPRYKTCYEENCRAAIFKLGYCEKHYEAWRASKSGEDKAPEAVAAPIETPAKAPAEVAPTEAAPKV